jgi:serine/threonine-protein kinase RIO1
MNERLHRIESLLQSYVTSNDEKKQIETFIRPEIYNLTQEIQNASRLSLRSPSPIPVRADITVENLIENFPEPLEPSPKFDRAEKGPEHDINQEFIAKERTYEKGEQSQKLHFLESDRTEEKFENESVPQTEHSSEKRL